MMSSALGLPFKIQKLWFSNNNIIYLFTSWMLIVYANRKYFCSKFINYMASSVLAIYLITDSNQLRPLDKQLLPLVLAWWGYLVIVLVCLGCLLIDKIRITITDKIIDVFKSRKQ